MYLAFGLIIGFVLFIIVQISLSRFLLPETYRAVIIILLIMIQVLGGLLGHLLDTIEKLREPDAPNDDHLSAS